MSVYGATETEAAFQVSFWSPDPRRYGPVHSFSGPTAEVHHYGSFPATPEVRVTGPRAAPYTVACEGHSVTVTQALTAGQEHRIDMGSGWVYRDGVLQLGVVSSADVFTIPPGRVVTVTGPSSMTVLVPDTFV